MSLSELYAKYTYTKAIHFMRPSMDQVMNEMQTQLAHLECLPSVSIINLFAARPCPKK